MLCIQNVTTVINMTNFLWSFRVVYLTYCKFYVALILLLHILQCKLHKLYNV